REDIHNLAAVRAELGQMRAFRNSDKQSISELKLAQGIIFKLIEKRLFSRFCSLYPSVFLGSLKSFLGVTKCPQRTTSFKLARGPSARQDFSVVVVVVLGTC